MIKEEYGEYKVPDLNSDLNELEKLQHIFCTLSKCSTPCEECVFSVSQDNKKEFKECLADMMESGKYPWNTVEE